MANRTRIVWTELDKQLLIDIVVALRATDPKLSKLDALREAQKQLASSGVLANRTRRIDTLTTFPWFDGMLSATVARLAKEQRAEEEQRRIQQERDVEQAVANLSKVPVSALVQAIMDRLSGPDTSLAEVFAPMLSMVVASVQDDVIRALTPVVERVVAQAAAGQTFKKPAVPDTARRPRVIVIGLKGSQPQSIKRKFSDSLDITFFESSVPSSQLKSCLKHTDHVFFMSGWNSHSVQDVVRNSRVSFDYVNGTNSNLDNCMSTFLQRAASMS